MYGARALWKHRNPDNPQKTLKTISCALYTRCLHSQVHTERAQARDCYNI